MIAWLRKSKDGRKLPAVFLDRDGTLIHDRPGRYLTDPAKLIFYRHTFRALGLLSDAGFRLIVATNQAVVGRGYMTLEKSKAVNRRLQKELAAKGVQLDGIYFCPHAPSQGCACRKPAPGLIREAARHHKISFAESFVIGDKLSDMKLASGIGLKRIFVKSGHGRSQLAKYPQELKKVSIKRDLLAAARWIVKHKQGALKKTFQRP